jgi:hypothetical protein
MPLACSFESFHLKNMQKFYYKKWITFTLCLSIPTSKHPSLQACNSPSLIVYFSTFTTKYQKEHASNSKPVGTWNGFMRSFGAIVSSIVATPFLAITTKRLIYFFQILPLVISKHDTHDNFFYHLCNSFKQSFCIVLFLPSWRKFKKSFSYFLLVHGQLETILCRNFFCIHGTFLKITHVL